MSGQVALDLPRRWYDGFDRVARALGSREPPVDLYRLTGGLGGKTFAFRLHEQPFVLKVYVEDGEQARPEFDNLAVVSVARVATPEQC